MWRTREESFPSRERRYKGLGVGLSLACLKNKEDEAGAQVGTKGIG